MANTETTVSNLKINRLTQTQLENASSLSNTEAYWVDPQFTGGKVLATDSNGDIVESTVTPSSIGTVKSVNNASPDSNGNVAITIPTVNNATLTITQGGTTKGTFTANASSNVTIDVDAGGYHPQIFTFQWSDHLLNDIQWLRGDTFSWQDGSVYVTAYNHLVDDITGKSLQTETIAGYTISYYLADDGHKIAPDTEETDILGLYNDTGVAWYYILDTTNERFKLPRELPITDKSKGNGMTLGLTDGTNNYGTYQSSTSTWGMVATTTMYSTNVGTTGDGDVSTKPTFGVTTDPTKSGIISHRANENGKLYLYFYVGEYEQSAVEQTAGLNADLFNAKVDLNASNLNAQGQSLISGLPMPSDTYEAMTVGASGSTYTAPANGWFVANAVGNSNAHAYMFLYTDTTARYSGGYTWDTANYTVWLPVLKNDVVTYQYYNTSFPTGSPIPHGLFFIYAQGSESEA